ncbi:hypothetical protein FB107DRAFT_275955 [Schizophyllum commune]
MLSRKYGAPTTSAHAPADPPVNNIASSVRDVGFRDITCAPSTSSSTTRTTLGTPDDIQTTPSRGGRSPPSQAMPLLSPSPLITGDRRVARHRQIIVPLIPMPSVRGHEGPSQRRRYGPPHVDVVPRPPALRHRRSRATLRRSRVRSTPFPPPVVVTNHAAATFAFDAGLLYALNDAPDVAHLGALNVLVAILGLLAAALIERYSGNALNVAILDALDATVALCVAALIERRVARGEPLVGDDETARGRRRDSTSETTARQDVVDELGELLPSSVARAMWADIGCIDRTPRS